MGENGLLPGYKFLKKVTVKGECQGNGESCKKVDLVLTLKPTIDSSFKQDIKYAVYKSTNSEAEAITCTNTIKNTETVDATSNTKYYYDGKCNISSQVNKYDNNNFNESVDTGEIQETEYKGYFDASDPQDITILIEDVDGTTDDAYYIVVDYSNNTEADQNTQQGKTFKITLDAALQA